MNNNTIGTKIVVFIMMISLAVQMNNKVSFPRMKGYFYEYINGFFRNRLFFVIKFHHYIACQVILRLMHLLTQMFRWNMAIAFFLLRFCYCYPFSFHNVMSEQYLYINAEINKCMRRSYMSRSLSKSTKLAAFTLQLYGCATNMYK